MNYNFKLNFTANTVWETEFNETYSTADVISPNVAVYGSLRKSSDNDWYRINYSGGMTFLEFTHGYLETGESRWKVYLYNNSFNEIASFDYQGNTTNVSKNIGQLLPGTYYIKVCSYYSSTYSDLDYRLKIGSHIHSYKSVVTKATTLKNGKIEKVCTRCGKVASTTKIARPVSVKLSTTVYTYSGKVKTPSVIVRNSDGKTISSSNYKVTYASGRTKVGTYKVSVTMKGNYTGTLSTYFTICPRPTSISKVTAGKRSFTVRYAKQGGSGYEVQYGTNSGFKGAKATKVTSYKTTSKKISKLSSRKKYYVRVRTYSKVGSKTYYSAWSKAKTVKTK